MTREIYLTHGFIALVDDEDFESLNQWNWYPDKKGNRIYAIRLNGRSPSYMHREIMNTPRGLQVDHIDGNGLNNTRANLRNCTRTQNMQNIGKSILNTSGYKGVNWNKEKNKWQAKIRINGKTTHLGWYSNIEDAACAYDIAAKQHHGEFARTNF